MQSHPEQACHRHVTAERGERKHKGGAGLGFAAVAVVLKGQLLERERERRGQRGQREEEEEEMLWNQMYSFTTDGKKEEVT